jgi:hypothetical protein
VAKERDQAKRHFRQVFVARLRWLRWKGTSEVKKIASGRLGYMGDGKGGGGEERGEKKSLDECLYSSSGLDEMAREVEVKAKVKG